jgi:hypothetical protein
MVPTDKASLLEIADVWRQIARSGHSESPP